MLLGYSSLGQPELSIKQCEALAEEFALDFLELRVLEGSLDLPAYFKSRGAEMSVVPVRVLGSSLRLTEASLADLDDFFRYAELAHRLSVPYIRVFGGGREGDSLPAEKFLQAAELINQIRETSRRKGWSFEILLETHSAFALPEYCKKLNELLAEPISLIWDTHHTWKFAGATLEETWAKLGPWVRHVHYKDSITEGETFRYVLPGEGEFPGSALFDLLREKQYEGGVSLEWEKLWHKELPPLRTALEKFCQIARPRKPGASARIA